MKPNANIAILLTLVFLGKFLILDTKVLHSILDTQEIALVNSLCKKKASKSADAEHVLQDSFVLVINSEAICSAAFDLPEITWSKAERIINFQDFGYLHPAVISTYFSKNYPPPKVLVK